MLTSSDSCLICDSNTPPKRYKIIENFQLWRCHVCDCIFLNPELENIDQEFIKETKSDTPSIEYWSTPKFYEDHMPIFKYYFAKRMKAIQRYKDTNHRVLDIGCGHGYWLEYLNEIGHNGIGIDLSIDAYHSCSSRGLNVKHSDFLSFESEDEYSLITACDVLEHVNSPIEFLIKCNRLLENDGIIYVQVPDVFGHRFPLNHNPLLPHHRWHFKYKSLKIALEHSGFEVLHHSTGVLGVVGEQVKRGRIPIWRSLYWKAASFFKVGNRLQIVARKRKTINSTSFSSLDPKMLLEH